MVVLNAPVALEQDDEGRWAGAAYSPKWTSTTYTLLLLHWLGLRPDHPQAAAGLECGEAVGELVDERVR